MRFVICDDDELLRAMVESIVAGAGHEVIGVVDTTAEAVAMIQHGRPDVVIAELALGYNTDFDVVQAALDVEATTIAFTLDADDDRLSGYAARPIVVPKPDLVALEGAIARLGQLGAIGAADSSEDRRRRPPRAAAGPVPTSVLDAQAFYEALNQAIEGDALVSLEEVGDGVPLGEAIRAVMRDTDRLLASPTSVRVLLPGAGSEGASSLLARLADAHPVPPGTRARTVVVGEGEPPSAAFERLKQAPEERMPV